MNLAEYCEERGAQSRAAELLGTSHAHVSNLLSGRRGWSSALLLRASTVLGLDMESEARRSAEARAKRMAS